MSTLVISITFISIACFIYESIIAPSLRLEVRYKLFALRDELRALRMRDKLGDEYYDYLQDSINTKLTWLARFDFRMMVRAELEMMRDPELKGRIEARRKFIDGCPIQEAQTIRTRSVKLLIQAIVINNGAVLAYVLPGIVLGACYEWIMKKVKALAWMPGADVESISAEPAAA